jgi:hypothetical protein
MSAAPALADVIAKINGAPAKIESPWTLLGAWLATDKERHVREIRHLADGSWRVVIQGRLRSYGCDSKQGLENAIRTAVGVAWTNGER